MDDEVEQLHVGRHVLVVARHLGVRHVWHRGPAALLGAREARLALVQLLAEGRAAQKGDARGAPRLRRAQARLDGERGGGGAVARGLRGARPGGQLVVAIEAEQEARLAGDRARD